MPKPRLRLADLVWLSVVASLLCALFYSESKRAAWEFRCRSSENSDRITALYIASYLHYILATLPPAGASPAGQTDAGPGDAQRVNSAREDLFLMTRLLRHLAHKADEPAGVRAKTNHLLLYGQERQQAAREWLADGE